VPARERSSLRRVVVACLAALDAIAVENPALPGTPDVNYAEGWLELKSLTRWPANRNTPVRVEHWTPEQKVRHLRRSRVGGETYVLIESVQEKEVLLLEGGVAARILGRVPVPELRAAAVARWADRAEMRRELPRLLSSRSRDFPDDP